MNRIATLEEQDRSELFKETAARKGIHPAVVEKDFWVCWVLGKLFTSEFFHDKIIFKGGTSLSKVYNLIQRFSEDIDLILDWNQLTHTDPNAQRSKTQQQKLNDQLREASKQYLCGTFVPELNRILETICTARIGDDPDTIHIAYPLTAREPYLRSEILLEPGPLAAWCPNDTKTITPYAAEEFPGQFKTPRCPVRVIKAMRTFWEKATILHAEAHSLETHQTPLRHSRHYYDLAMMAAAPVKQEAFADLELLKEVVEFKKRFYSSGVARYDLATPGSFKLVPPDMALKALKDDYSKMDIMFFNEPPSFEEIIDTLSVLEQEIKSL